ncbi:MAG: hypothetical protein QM831_03855 [Kofleriaceae bacterium]
MSAYREGGEGFACPVCSAPIVAGSCGEQCGDWWPKAAIDPAVDWSVVELAEPYAVFGAVAELPCPECANPMTTSLRAKIEFAHCDVHGLWLPRSYRAAFDQLGGWTKVLVSRKRR